jgi:hypothetical protein
LSLLFFCFLLITNVKLILKIYLASTSELEEVNIGFLTLDAPEDILATDVVSKSASSFTSSSATKFSGVGLNSLICAFDPMDTFEDNRLMKPSMFIPTCAELDSDMVKCWSSDLMRTIVVNVDMSKISETKCDLSGRTVQLVHLERLKPFFKGTFYTTHESKVTLRELNCSEGAASEISCCDAYWKDSVGVARGISEAKISTAAPVEATRQAVSEAINMAIAQVKLGVAPNDVLIPIFSTTGHLVQFSVVVLLLPCFPMVVNLSKVLDLTDDKDRLLAAGHLFKIKDYVDTQLIIENKPVVNLGKIGLSLKRYHLKEKKDFYCSQKEFNSSVLYFLHVLGRLHKNEMSRRAVLFPYCFRQDYDSYQIVFPRLHDFRIGLPDDEKLKEEFLIACKNSFVI